ncbi:Hypothetical predicted protein [Cloeon dipterum]|uniref:BTB domain-containing protein n=1 Tax=Cloeon dipterum TaxID=197152 RepID=A0A8S1DF21_9INSE|nr:Hypothetical predicted protein [Cloeon dipterum]
MSKLLVKWASFGYREQEIRTAIVFGKKGENVIIVLKNDEVLAIGKNQDGCLGTGNEGEVKELTRIEILCTHKIEGFVCGGNVSNYPSIFAISGSGSVFSWGQNMYGQLGLGTRQYTTVPTKISGSLKGKRVVQVACGAEHTLALTSEGEVYAFGRNYCGQLGLGTTADNLSRPQRLGGLLDGKIVTSVACQHSSSFALLHSGEIYSWGNNTNGRLGSSSTAGKKLSPCKVIGLEGVLISQIVCGAYFTLALSDDGKLFSWGENFDGQLGNGTTEHVKRPAIISTEMGKVREVAATHDKSHPCAAITEKNQVYIWGSVNGIEFCSMKFFDYRFKLIVGKTIETPMLTFLSSLDDVFTVFYPPVNYQQFRLKITKVENNQKGSTIIERFRKEFDNPETADYAFIFEGKKIHVHKIFLTIGSDVFKKKFLGDWDDSRKKEQIVEGHSYEAFYAFLKYFYTDEVDIMPELALEVYAIAHFYLVSDLMEECEKILKSGLTMQNVADVYEKAIVLGAKDLCEFCFKFCRENLVDVVDSIESDESKSEVFLEVFRWAANQKKN